LERIFLGRGESVKHLQNTQTILDRISVKVVVEVAIGRFDRVLDLLHLRHPVTQLLLSVVIIIPGSLAAPMPAHVRKISSYVHLRRQQWLVNDRICYIVFRESLPRLVSQPRLVTKLYRVLETVREERKKLFEVPGIILVTWRHLDQ